MKFEHLSEHEKSLIIDKVREASIILGTIPVIFNVNQSTNEASDPNFGVVFVIDNTTKGSDVDISFPK